MLIGFLCTKQIHNTRDLFFPQEVIYKNWILEWGFWLRQITSFVVSKQGHVFQIFDNLVLNFSFFIVQVF